MDNDVVIPLWSIITVMVTAIIALFAVVARALIHKAKEQPAPVLNSCPGFDANNYVTKEVCDEIQNTTHVQIELLDAKVVHTNQIVDRIEKNQDEKHKSLIKHVDESFKAVRELIKTGK